MASAIITRASNKARTAWLRTLPTIHSYFLRGVAESLFVTPLLLNSLAMLVSPITPFVIMKAAVRPGT